MSFGVPKGERDEPGGPGGHAETGNIRRALPP
jgi:hypothetical protein